MTLALTKCPGQSVNRTYEAKQMWQPFSLALAPIAFALACGGAWFGLSR